MVDVLNEKSIPLARREHSDRFRRDRPARQPLNDGAETVCATEEQMLTAVVAQQVGGHSSPPLHFLHRKARIVRLTQTLQIIRKRRDRKHKRSAQPPNGFSRLSRCTASLAIPRSNICSGVTLRSMR